MSFRFECKVTAWDMWKLSMGHIYHSIVGVYNIILAVALILLTVKLWDPEKGFLMGILIFVSVLFPVIQPVVVYFRAASQVAALPEELVLEINDTGIHVTADGQLLHLDWSRIKGTIVERNMLILAIDGGKGYMLTNKVLGSQKEELLQFVESKLKKHKQ